jgi:thiamine-monophosphate kinase
MKSEFDFIEKIRRTTQPKNAKIGIGDDCAVVPKDSQTDLVITADLLVEDIDFRLDWTTPELLGGKALSVSLSDIAAMGATPVWAMLSIGIPENIWRADFLAQFCRDWFATAKKFNVELIGGDVSKTPDKIVIDSIAAGEVKKNRAVLRSGARPGDLIFVSGALGGAAAGLKLLESGIRPANANIWQRNLIRKQLNPRPRVHFGKALGENQIPSAMIDLSDGLSSDLAHICRASGVGARIFADKIPLHKNLRSLTKSFDEQLDLALNGGEDFELLFTVHPEKNFQIQKAGKNLPFHRIGEVTANAEIVELVKASETIFLPPKGFRHF